MYYNARYYDPVTARFVSADIVQSNSGGFDPYAYVMGNPETFVDPSGHDVCESDPSACDSNATPAEIEATEGNFRGSSGGGSPSANTPNPPNAFVVPTIEGTLADGSTYLYTPDDGSILIETPDGQIKLLEQGDDGYDQALQDLDLDQSDVGSSEAGAETRAQERTANEGRQATQGNGNTSTDGSGNDGTGSNGSGSNGNGSGGTNTPPDGGGASSTVNLNPNVSKLSPPPTPSGMTQPEFGKLVGWGKTPASMARILTIGPEDITAFLEAGLTPELGQQWADFYANEAMRNPGNPSALGRYELMQFITDLLGHF